MQWQYRSGVQKERSKTVQKKRAEAPESSNTEEKSTELASVEGSRYKRQEEGVTENRR